jgi:mannose-6-phosphate isomerase-like protein (cupin superfamily)
MRLLITCLGLATAVFAQQPVVKTFTSAADVAAMISKAKNERKPDQANFIQPLLRLAPYNVSLEYRVQGVDTTPNIHETEAEIVYVVDGAGTLTTGGKLLGVRRLNPTNVTGTGIEGGTPRLIAKGDFCLIPENTAHGFTETEGTLVIMPVHLPMGGATNASK